MYSISLRAQLPYFLYFRMLNVATRDGRGAHHASGQGSALVPKITYSMMKHIYDFFHYYTIMC